MMKPEWIAPYIKNIGKRVCLQGYTSCSRDPKVGLKFALQNQKPDQTPVLFVVAINVNSGHFSMSNEAYTAYPEEGEVLLTEGNKVTILGIDQNFKIENTDQDMELCNGKTVTVVYLK